MSTRHALVLLGLAALAAAGAAALLRPRTAAPPARSAACRVAGVAATDAELRRFIAMRRHSTAPTADPHRALAERTALVRAAVAERLTVEDVDAKAWVNRARLLAALLAPPSPGPGHAEPAVDLFGAPHVPGAPPLEATRGAAPPEDPLARGTALLEAAGLTEAELLEEARAELLAQAAVSHLSNRDRAEALARATTRFAIDCSS